MVRWSTLRPDRADIASGAPSLGPWILGRAIGHCAVGARFMAFHGDTGEPALAYRVDRRIGADPARSGRIGLGSDHEPTHAHILAPSEVHRDAAGDLWLIAPFVGSARGLLTLEQVASARDAGVIGRHEAMFAGLQLLGAAAHAQTHGLIHGPVDAAHVLVHPRGSLMIELYGVEHRLRELPVPTDTDRAGETRSIVAMVARLAFGSASVDLPTHPDSFERWVTSGLQGSGYSSPQEALAALELVKHADTDGVSRSWIREIMSLAGWALTRR